MKINKLFTKSFPYILLIILTLPIILGYLWIVISTFSTRSYGLIPVDQNGNYFRGLTLSNWTFLTDKTKTLNVSIWLLTFNTLIIAVGLTVGVVLISMMAGYALSRIKFPGRNPGAQALSLFDSYSSLISQRNSSNCNIFCSPLDSENTNLRQRDSDNRGVRLQYFRRRNSRKHSITAAPWNMAHERFF